MYDLFLVTSEHHIQVHRADEILLEDHVLPAVDKEVASQLVYSLRLSLLHLSRLELDLVACEPPVEREGGEDLGVVAVVYGEDGAAEHALEEDEHEGDGGHQCTGRYHRGAQLDKHHAAAHHVGHVGHVALLAERHGCHSGRQQGRGAGRRVQPVDVVRHVRPVDKRAGGGGGGVSARLRGGFALRRRGAHVDYTALRHATWPQSCPHTPD